MTDTLQMLINSEGFMPHGHCYLWTPSLLWTYVLSDALIGIAYFSILLALIIAFKRRPDIPFHRIFGMFSMFIFFCGARHVMSIWTFWHPTCWLDALPKAMAAEHAAQCRDRLHRHPADASAGAAEGRPGTMELIDYLLRAFGHTTLHASDGEAGLADALRESPDMVLCDIYLPKLDGYGVVRQIRADPRLQNLPMLAITALAMVGDRKKLLAAGFDGYFAKPIEPKNFVSQIEAFLPTISRT